MIEYFRSARDHPGWRLSKAENNFPFEKSKLFGIQDKFQSAKD